VEEREEEREGERRLLFPARFMEGRLHLWWEES
jgi:hypothetical protein